MKLKAVMFGISLCAGLTLLSAQVMAQPMTAQDMNTRLDNLYGTHDNYHAFFNALKENIVKKDKAAVAAVVKYPLFVQLKGKQVQIKTPKQFIENYDGIITPKISKIVKEQQFKGILATYRGIAFGNGEIWFAGISKENSTMHPNNITIQIISINNFM